MNDNQSDQSRGEAISARGTPNIVMGGGSMKISHPGVHRVGLASSSNATTHMVPYE